MDNTIFEEIKRQVEEAKKGGIKGGELTNAIFLIATIEELLDDSHRLESLQAMGVDNWQGYGEAMQYYREFYLSEEESN